MYKWWAIFTVHHTMIYMPYWSFPSRKTNIKITSPHLSTHYHRHVQCHTEPHMQTLYVEVNFTADICSLSARVFCNTQQDTVFDYRYIFLPVQQRLLSITTEHKHHREKENIYSIEFYWACFAITKQLGSEALVFYKHLTEMTAQRSTIISGCLNNTGCMDLIRLPVANNSRYSQFAQ